MPSGGDNPMEEHHGLNRCDAALALVSTLVGGGIVGLSNSFYKTGISMGLVVLLIMCIQTTYCVPLYLRAIEYLPGKPESMFEIGYLLFRRTGIFIVAFVVIFNSFGLILIYFITFGDTAHKIFHDVRRLSGHNDDNIWTAKATYIIILTACLTPVALLKELQELKLLSYTLMGIVIAFIILTFIQLCTEGVTKFNHDFNPGDKIPTFPKDYYTPVSDINHVLSALSVYFICFSC